MNHKYYRVTCDGVGIYEYFKKFLWNNVANPTDVWNDFIHSQDVTWLNKPNIYNDKNQKYFSYFNINGYNLFQEKTLPLILDFIDNDIIKTDIIEVDSDCIIYQDEYQIVVELDKKKVLKAREFCSKVKELAKEYGLSFFVVTEGASLTSNNGCEAVRHARDCHIDWEKEHNFDPYEDWSND